jgi:phospholipid transport system substrate-binding protein
MKPRKEKTNMRFLVGKVLVASLMMMLLPASGTSVFSAEEETPTEKIRRATQEITAVLNDFCKNPNGEKTECVTRIIFIADLHFDWEEMARRALAHAWEQRAPEEKKQFVSLFRDLLKNSYVGRIESYAGEEVVFEGEKIVDKYAIVKTKVVSTAKNEGLPVFYRLKKKNGEWLVYDIIIEGVSIVKNYYAQFQDVLKRSSYETLVQKLKEKIAHAES